MKNMPLDEYRKKRDFVQSPEPKGEINIISKEDIKENEDKMVNTKPIFVVQEHHARRLHWDFRLEMEGVLRSWAIPKGPPEEFGVRRLAIQTEDHPIEYANFEGEIPPRMYGAGTVKIWDRGELIIEEETDSKISFQLKGKKMTGAYSLIKVPNLGENSWLFFKKMEF